jgi:DNA-binding MarR family transcriptional regulator
MTDGFNIEDGWVTDSSVRELAEWYAAHCPGTSVAAFEAHLMVLRAYVTLLSDSPVDTAAGMSRARYNILRMVYQAPEKRLLMGDFADGMNVSPTNISKLVDTLVNDGLVRREPHNLDKRKTWAVITSEGEEVVEASLPLIGRNVEEVWSGLDEEEQKVLAHLLAKMRMNAVSRRSNRVLSVLRHLSNRRD